MRRLLATLALVLGPAAAFAQAKAGWGNVGKQQPEPPFWTKPLFDGFWMAWTPATLAFFAGIFALVGLMGVLEWRNPGGNPRHGVLGLDTTRGDRLFISLLGAAWIFLGWLFFFSTPLWGALALAVAWAAFVFWKV
jgi:predicted small integral membrane protein